MQHDSKLHSRCRTGTNVSAGLPGRAASFETGTRPIVHRLAALVVIVSFACALAIHPPVAGAADDFQWQTATPESQKMSAEALEAYRKDLEQRGTKSLLVIRNDKIVLEWYEPGRSATDKHYTASLAKALVGGMSLALAIDDGKITLDDPAHRFVPQWKADAQKSKITIRHLGSHTSGLDDSRPNEEAKWKDDFWQRQDPPEDPFTISRDITPVLFPPGSDFQYSNPGIAMLTHATTTSIQDGATKDVRTLLRDRIMRPLAIPDDQWSIGYGQTFEVDGLPLVPSWGGGGFTPRAAARVGQLVLHGGQWDGQRLVSQEAIRLVTSDAGLPGGCGMGWWTNGGGRYPDLPADAVWGAGAQDQILFVVPSLNLVMIRNGGELLTEDEETRRRERVAQILFDPLVNAINESPRTGDSGRRSQGGDAPYPPSEVITRIEWAPADSVTRKAKGSDNWPITWADDDAMYTAYGDGWGFQPFLEKKLSMGLAKIVGGADDFRGINIRSETLEELGDGARGRKASGMLCIDGVLYLLARNAGNSQLAWSEDHGKTWTWSDWKWTTSFGCPTFLNFGRNYEGARDEFVYVYSHDSDSAYEPADRMVLARVPQDRISEREAYEFFTHTDEQGEPHWSGNIDDRGAVFTHPGRCYRTGITYNASLKRYLWCQTLPESEHRQGTRYDGGFGIYDAPEPWGPWTTVYFTNLWDVGPGETSSFPTKWMSDDGKTLHLVFSGDDYFSVRQAKLLIAD